MRLRTILIPLAVSALVVVPAAMGHVTLNPGTAPAGSELQLDIRVPNEEDNANTTKVDLLLPDGFVTASYAPVPGWSVKVITKKLATPVQTDDGPVDFEVKEIVWTGHGQQGKIAPGQFQDFPLSVAIPGKAGDTLTFKALQTYSDGKIVRWIGPPGTDEPAPQVKVTAAVPDARSADAQTVSTTTEAASSDGGRDGLTLGLAIAGVALGALALVAVLIRMTRKA